MAFLRNILLLSFIAAVCSQAENIWEDNHFTHQAKPEVYTTSWAVEITEGGEKMANTLAEKYGFKNLGKLEIGSQRDFFHFELKQSSIRSDSPHTSKSNSLISESCTGLVEQQVVRSRVLKSYTVPTDPLFDKQWFLLNTGYYGDEFEGYDLNVEPAWLQGVTGCNVTVAVVDDGMDFRHPDLWDNFAPDVSYDFIEEDYDPSSNNPWHGTSCSGIIGSAKNDICGIGIAYEVNLGSIALIGANTDLNEARSLSFKNDIIDIYSNSWGPPDSGFHVEGPGELTKMALQSGVTEGRDGKGSIYVWANGNGGSVDDCAADGYTQSIYTIAIGAIGVDGDPSPFDEVCSAKLATTYVTDPYGNSAVATTALDDQCTESFGGTSAATPMASGIFALVLETNSHLTWRDVQYLIVYTSNTNMTNTANSFFNGAGLLVSHHFGFGVLDGEAIVTRARHWINVPAQLEECIIPSADSGKANYFMPFTSTIAYSGSMIYLEHVIVRMTVQVCNTSSFFSRRGDIGIQLTSPSGTTSNLLSYRRSDYFPDGYFDWPFMSVHFWGEDPRGEWKLTISSANISTEINVTDIEFKFYGVCSIPESVDNIPEKCHPDCRRGCAREGSEFCDACVNLRNAYSYECIDTCPQGYIKRNGSGYCYDPAVPTENCSSPLKDKDDILATCADAGYDDCCTDEDCRRPSLISCYCDVDCYTYGDCCGDISSAGCSPGDKIVGTVFPYIPLGVTEGVATRSVPAEDEGLSSPLLIEFPYGCQVETIVAVGANGYFTFQFFNGFIPFQFNGERDLALVAPFFTDTDISFGIGSVTYEVHNSTTSTEILSEVSSLISEHMQTQFSAQWLMVAEWKDVPPFGNYNITNTLQGLIVTDFVNSYAVFTYYCGDLSYSNGASIGFTTTDGFFANHPASIRGKAEQVACLNEPITPWVNVIYELTRTCATDCVYFNQTYATGETFPAGDDCNYCTCLSGEAVCTQIFCPPACRSDEFRCPEDPYGYCYPLRYRCDSYNDCESGYDEQNCSTIEFTSPLSIDEGQSGTLEFCLTVTEVLEDYIYRHYYLGLTGKTSDLEYDLHNNTIIFKGSYYVGESECVGIDVDVYDDNVVEGTEKITDQTNEISIQVFIIDNDYLRIGFREEVYSVSESAGMLYIIVEAVPDENGNIPDVGIPLGIRITSKDGSAIAGVDYQGLLTTHYFRPGDYPFAVIHVAIFNDLIPDGDERFSVELKTCDISIILINAVTEVVIVDDEDQIDVVVCTVELDQPIEVVGNTADYSFSGIGSGIESFTCKLDGVELQDCPTSGTLTNLAPGLHRFRVVPEGCRERQGVTFRFEV